MPLSPEKIEAIRKRVDIAQVVGAVVSLRKQGQRWVGLCPFHGEKTPSFSVTSDRGFYYCFGCHAGGDVFSFVMRHEGLDFQGAARKLADIAGIELEPESPAARERRQLQSAVAGTNAYAQAFFVHALWAEDGRPARAYLAERGIDEATAKRWQLGYGGPTGRLLAYLAKKNVPPALAAKAGFLTDDGRRGLFDERLVFPIFESADRLAGFGGRRLGDGYGPKYVNSRESPLFSKRRLLYGWPAAEDEIRRSRRVVLVEGYMDVLAAHRAGVVNAVAALGTALTEEHARACARLAKEAVLLLDGDDAGVRASREAAAHMVHAGLRTLLVVLPADDDPDSLVRREGAEALRTRLERAVPAVEHFIDTSVRPEMSIAERSTAAEELAPLLGALSSGLERDLYAARLAERLGVTVEQLEAHLRRSKPKPKRATSETNSDGSGADGNAATSAGSNAAGNATGAGPATAPVPTRPTAHELKMLRELLLFPELRPRLDVFAEYTSDPMRLLLDELAGSDEPLSEVLARHLDAAAATRLAPPPLAPAENMGDGQAAEAAERHQQQVQRTFDDVLTRLKQRHIEAMRKQVLEEVAAAEADGAQGEEAIEEALRKHGGLTRRKRDLKPPRTAS